MKTDVDKQLLVWKMKKSSILLKSIGNFFKNKFEPVSLQTQIPLSVQTKV